MRGLIAYPGGEQVIYNGEGEPTFAAPMNSIAIDSRNNVFIQSGTGFGAFWRLLSTAKKPVMKHWIHTGILPGYDFGTSTLTQFGNMTPPAIADATSTTEYYTSFNVPYAMELYGLGFILGAYTSGLVNVKAAIYNRQLDRPYHGFPGFPYKDFNDNYAEFALASYTPANPEFIFVPRKDPANADPVILEPGEYHIAHIWGTQLNGKVLTRALIDITTDNNNRSDRTRASVNYNTRVHSTDGDRYLGTSWSSGASGTASLANLDWCLYGKII